MNRVALRPLWLFVLLCPLSCLLPFVLVAQTTSLATDTLSPCGVGLVLSGGGAKGIAHIGLIQALEEQEIPIDYITGTSIGAVIGGLYAVGLSPQEMMTLIRSRDFEMWQTGAIPAERRAYYKRSVQRPSYFSYKISLGESRVRRGFLSRTTLIAPEAMKLGVLQLFTPAELAAGGNFDRLFVPFRPVAGDLCRRRPVAFANGNLGESIRASMAFPFVFQAPEIDGTTYYDGGIYNNFPIDIMMRDFRPDFVIGSVVAENPRCPETGDLLGQLEGMVVQYTDYHVPPELGVRIRILLPEVGLLDFKRAASLYAVGYETGLRYADSIRARLDRLRPADEVQRRRRAYRATLPAWQLRQVEILGLSGGQRRYVARHFRRHDFASIRDGYYSLAADARVADLRPRVVQDSSGVQCFRLGVRVHRDLDLRLGGLLTALRQSRLYLGVGYQGMHCLATDIDVDVQLGERYRAALWSLRAELPTDLPIISTWRCLGIYERYRGQELIAPAEVPWEELRRIRWGASWQLEAPLGRCGLLRPGIAYDLIQCRCALPLTGADAETQSLPTSHYLRAELRSLRAGIELRWSQHTLQNYPDDGYDYHISAYRHFGGHLHTAAGRLPASGWWQLRGGAERYIPLLPAVRLGLSVQGVWSDMPLPTDPRLAAALSPAYRPEGHAQLMLHTDLTSRRYVAAALSPVLRLSRRASLRADLRRYQNYDRQRISTPQITWPAGVWVHDVAFLFRATPFDVALFLQRIRGDVGRTYVGIRVGSIVNWE